VGEEEGKRLVLTVLEAAKLLGLSRGLAYEGVRLRQIPSIRIGRRILIPRAALLRLLDGGLSGSPRNPRRLGVDSSDGLDKSDVVTYREQVTEHIFKSEAQG
jgi:excisionase family DNA binding protein